MGRGPRYCHTCLDRFAVQGSLTCARCAAGHPRTATEAPGAVSGSPRPITELRPEPTTVTDIDKTVATARAFLGIIDASHANGPDDHRFNRDAYQARIDRLLDQRLTATNAATNPANGKDGA